MKRIAALALLAAPAFTAPAPASLPVYAVATVIEGDIRVSGSPADAGLLKLWEAGFREFHPRARVVAKLFGPESTMAGIYTDTADLALLAREMRQPVEGMAFEWVKLYKPMTLEVANAGVRTTRPAACLAIFVHRDNPLARLTLAQLNAIFGGDPSRPAVARTWGEVGATGAWASRPIQPLGPPIDSLDALYFRRTVLNNNFKWNARLREFARPADALATLAHEPGGIAFAPLAAANDGVKMLALAATPAGPFVALEAGSVRARTYPLARAVTVAFDRNPSHPIAPRLEEFLRFILSEQGQAAVARDGAYVPLDPETAAAQAARIE